MNPQQLDEYLSGLAWQDMASAPISRSDLLLFLCFRTVCPFILHESHRFVESSESEYQKILRLLPGPVIRSGEWPIEWGGELGDLSDLDSSRVRFEQWVSPGAQLWIRDQYGNFKYGDFYRVIYGMDRRCGIVHNLDQAVLSVDLPAIGEFFRVLRQCLSMVTWMYVFLPEEYHGDLILVGRENESILQLLDGKVNCSQAEWVDGKAVLPLF